MSGHERDFQSRGEDEGGGSRATQAKVAPLRALSFARAVVKNPALARKHTMYQGPREVMNETGAREMTGLMHVQGHSRGPRHRAPASTIGRPRERVAETDLKSVSYRLCGRALAAWLALFARDVPSRCLRESTLRAPLAAAEYKHMCEAP